MRKANIVHHHRSRGVASVEAVVALPVFVILFVGMLFVRDLTGAKQLADQEARRCAWQYSWDNCGDTPPKGCEGVVSPPSLGEIHSNIDTAMKHGLDAFTASGEGAAAVKRILAGLVTDALIQALTKKFEAQKVAERDRPGLFGGGMSQVAGKYRLACNIPTQKQSGVATAVWHQFRP